ncbi:MAG: CBS and ACT domain-containing protein [Desulfobacterales bacterium]|jgi:acetoin utilization protein AcuB
MLVKDWMSKPAITIDADALLTDAIKLLRKHEIHMLPVMQHKRLVGMVTDQDLKRASAPDYSSSTSFVGLDHRLQKTISEIMTISPVTISYNQTIEDTAELLLVHNKLGLPVINQAGDVVGMITKSDMFRFILSTIGMGKDGIQFAIELVDRPGCVKEITDIMRDYGGRVGTFFSTCERARKGYRRAYIRVFDIDRPGLSRLKEVLREKVKMLYVINQREKTSEIF